MPGIGFRTSVSNKAATLLPGGPGSQPMPTTDFFIYEAAQVEEIVQNEASNLSSTTSTTANTGRVKIRFINTGKGTNSSELDWADPLLPHQTMPPLIGEYVLVFKNEEPVLATVFQVIEFSATVFGSMLQDQLSNIQSKRIKLFEGFL